MDSRAKQRLTGAVILVAFFVVLVPELLTGPGKDAAPAAGAKDDGLHSYTIDLDSPTSSVTPANAPQPAVSLPAPEPASPMTAAATPPASASSESQKPATTVVMPATPAPATPVPAPTPAPAPPAATPNPVVPTKGSFVVQLGSFGSRENAERLVKEMTAKGFSAFIAPITTGGRELYRVRVGPTHDRPAAEALATQLQRIGQSGSIVPIS